MKQSPKSILIIDDDEALRVAMVSAVEKAGYAVVQAANGQDGIAVALAERPDLIVLDILMPKMDGRETLREIRSREETSDIPVILLTSVSDLSYVAETTTYENVDYLVKTDVSLADIVAKITDRVNV
jgi:DNA-binding response OmpR family regulator